MGDRGTGESPALEPSEPRTVRTFAPSNRLRLGELFNSVERLREHIVEHRLIVGRGIEIDVETGDAAVVLQGVSLTADLLRWIRLLRAILDLGNVLEAHVLAG